jgi:hypothetical protein
MLCTFAMISTVVTILLVLFTSFLAKRIDQFTSWSYAVIFIPVWILDAFVAVSILPRAFEPSQDLPNETHEEEHVARGQDDKEKRARMRGGFTVVYFVLIVAFQILVVLREDGVLVPPVDKGYFWTAAVIFAPYWVLEALNLVHCALNYTHQIKALNGQYQHAVEIWRESGGPEADMPKPLTLVQYVVLLGEAFWWWMIRVSFAILLVLKLDGNLPGTHWAVVFIPWYLAGLRYVLLLVLGFRQLATIQHAETLQQARSMVACLSIAFIIGAAFAYSFIGMLIVKLQDPATLAMASVFIPLWIVLGCGVCCCGCCLPCLVCVQGLGSVGDEDGMPPHDVETGTSSSGKFRLADNGMYMVVSPDKRLVVNKR